MFRPCCKLCFGHHEAAANGKVGFLKYHVALTIGGHQDHSVRVAGQGWAIVEYQILLRRKGHGGQAVRMYNAGFADEGESLFRGLCVICLGDEAREPEDHRPVRGMADAGEGERSVQAGPKAVSREG